VVRELRHCGIVVSSMDRALHFYCDLLGLVVEKESNEAGSYLDNMLSLVDSAVATAKLSAGLGPTLVELLEFKSHRDDEPAAREIYSVGPTHIAFTVSDLDQTYHALSEAGVRFNAPPQLSPDGYAKVTFCKDPDGTSIELVQVLG
jgi:catechol 2,3-dioxygenase-like lactoylglutathione lyase family enzyme